jgi:hypothetical protein
MLRVNSRNTKDYTEYREPEQNQEESEAMKNDFFEGEEVVDIEYEEIDD